ncbi:hypothetical protein R3P38DRAFT_429915 [Favolaschia claudopus]|uniref:Secreted protein n=1 Tax=Favolaschia claudopus TaxID=2862362 RepID=A0AAW0CPI6_9AGAR
MRCRGGSRTKISQRSRLIASLKFTSLLCFLPPQLPALVNTEALFSVSFLQSYQVNPRSSLCVYIHRTVATTNCSLNSTLNNDWNRQLAPLAAAALFSIRHLSACAARLLWPSLSHDLRGRTGNFKSESLDSSPRCCVLSPSLQPASSGSPSSHGRPSYRI